MNDKRITPGPWSTYKTTLARSGLSEYQIHWSDAGECVAEIVHGEANAHLIAAAPDLLYALQLMLEDNCCMSDRQRDEIARNAIKKAILG